MAAFHTWLMQAESLHFNHVMVVSFQIHCNGEQRQNFRNRFIVQILIDPNCTVLNGWSLVRRTQHGCYSRYLLRIYIWLFNRLQGLLRKWGFFFLLNKMQISASSGLGVIITHRFARWAVSSEGWKFNWGNEATGGGLQALLQLVPTKHRVTDRTKQKIFWRDKTIMI